MATNEAVISFTMAGYSFNANDVTQLLGIEPSILINGNTRLGDAHPAISSWELLSDKLMDDEIDVFTMVNDLIKVIEPVKDNILIAIERFNLVPKMVVKLKLSNDNDETVPDIGLGSRSVKFLASIGAFIEVEITKH